MEQSPSCLKLFGSWASSYTHRVQLALKLKGLEFEYVEEDLTNKSPSLLLYNPVYKKVPILLHLDRPIIESVIILQYIDETWTDHPIMPIDPYERAIARFWCHFADDKLGPAAGAVFGSSGEEQKAAVCQVHENLKLIEAELREGAFKGRRFFGGDKIGILDIVFGCGSYWLAVFDEVMEVKLVDPEAFPLFHAWLRDFEEQKEVKEIIPAIDRLLEYARGIRQLMLNLKDTTSSTSTSTTTATATTVATNNSNNNVVIESSTSV
ncbi:glutathione transferase GST 23 [Elaeis guineensis]|uniref:glutathione transferase n=1 Tax=Elaeis guineensis var. tenera TaxID=51953 RepID=A0A6I9QEX1_ELAGV|nr:glutathione transferase GST 23 [Elaeis guineensis]